MRVPIEAVMALSKRKFTVAIRERLIRLNADGIQLGSRPRGYHPHKRSRPIERDLFSVREFARRYGRTALDAIPSRFIFRDGHRKAISREYVEDFMPAFRERN